jgi:glutamyl-tRNA synthetase
MVTVRFAPSPTGYLHLGSARTALFNYLFARHSGGRFLIRIEDTDLKRSDSKFLDEILEDLAWLGMDWDGKLLFQSHRFEVYREKARVLLERDLAYLDGEAIIFRVPPGRTIDVDDLIHGRITFQTETFKDQVLIKSDGSPSYNFACVVDDSFLEITHILRGDDHISNTPKQVLFYEALGLTPPLFGHMPLIMGPDGAKLSKRHGGVSVEEYRKEGYLPEALANYLILLGWYPGEEHEVLSLDEAVRMFEISAMNSVQARFDIHKLKWLNGEHIMRRPTDHLLPLLREHLRQTGHDLAGVDDAYLGRVLDLYKVRIKTLNEFWELADFFFTDDYAMDEAGLRKHLSSEESRALVRAFAGRLEGQADFGVSALEATLGALAAEKGVKPAAIIHPTRLAVSGKTKGAGLFEIMELLGRERVLKRMKDAGS